MAEQDLGAEFQDELGGADEQQTGDVQEQMTDPQTAGDATDTLSDRQGRGPEDPNDPQYKYWQAAYTQTRQRERAHYGKLEQEHQ
jgi:hypothetical protein